MGGNRMKIIIVNNNMQLGGVQKALHNLLWEIHDRYDVTLLLFAPEGPYMEDLPGDIKVQTTGSLFRYLGVSQGQCRGLDRIKRGVLAFLTKLLGRDRVMKSLLSSQEELEEEYDCAISYLHNGRASNFYGGTMDFVLHKIRAKKKVAFLHCDYRNNGSNYEENNRLIARFDTIAACSQGCRDAFLSVLPHLEERTVTVRNCHRFHQIRALAEEDPVVYEPSQFHVVMVTRLAHEKGIQRAMEACVYCRDQGKPFVLNLVGGGPMEKMLRAWSEDMDIEELVVFHGEQANPYRFMKNADLLLLTSFHEAAPMVLDEARCLGLPVMTVQTTSSNEMVLESCSGWVCDNEQQAINKGMLELLSNRPVLRQLKASLQETTMDNSGAVTQFINMIES